MNSKICGNGNYNQKFSIYNLWQRLAAWLSIFLGNIGAALALFQLLIPNKLQSIGSLATAAHQDRFTAVFVWMNVLIHWATFSHFFTPPSSIAQIGGLRIEDTVGVAAPGFYIENEKSGRASYWFRGTRRAFPHKSPSIDALDILGEVGKVRVKSVRLSTAIELSGPTPFYGVFSMGGEAMANGVAWVGWGRWGRDAACNWRSTGAAVADSRSWWLQTDIAGCGDWLSDE